MMYSRRSSATLCLFLCGIVVILCLPFVVLKISDARFFASTHTRTDASYHIETSAKDVPYVGHIFNTYEAYASSYQEIFIVSSQVPDSFICDGVWDKADAALKELESRGIISSQWVNEILPDLKKGFYCLNEECCNVDGLDNVKDEINYSTIVRTAGDRSLKLMLDLKYGKLLRVSYTGDGKFFATDDYEGLCSSFAAYQGLDILEDWGFNGKRLISKKASLSIECTRIDDSSAIQVAPRELILLEN